MAPFLRLLKHRQLSAGSEDGSAPLEELDAIKAAKGLITDARRLAIRLLSQREFTFSELVDRLETKGYTRPVSQRVVQQLQEEGLQSDVRFAEVFARSRMEKGYGPMLLRAEMRARGLSDALTDDYATHPHAYWIKQASLALEKRFREQPANREEWAKQARFLARRGFSADLIYSALGNQHT